MEFKEVQERLRAVENMVEEIIEEAKEAGQPGPEAVLLVLFHMQLTEKLKRIADLVEGRERSNKQDESTGSVIKPNPTLPNNN